MRRHLGKWARRQGIEAFRLYDRDIPQFPFLIELYGADAVVWEFEKRIPGIPDLSEWRSRARRCIVEALELDDSHIQHKLRRRGKQQYARIDQKQALRTVLEGGLRFEVNLSDYLDTGLFLDHRQTRAMLREEASGKDVLNLFAYTGAFSVYAGAGGARSVISVDLSSAYLERARRNWSLNQLPAERADFLEMDILQGLESLGRASFDLIVLDPPTFSSSKRMRRDFDIQRDAAGLLQRCALLLRRGGAIYFSTNFRRFRLPAEQLADWSIQDISARTIPPDFRDRRIHHAFRLQRNPA
ncbi:MAG: class I SAM-dependent methyltransferase [Leptospirales bacterium]|nr:class I SAM-dependent methyltransferase [Leptospirales bacterium]